ncbi:NUDIX domain-containing protein [Paenibacillus sp. CC-CFT747]|nr:NUDIX domain-containing protein [Paenibacillus sp. CC-CFT747]
MAGPRNLLVATVVVRNAEGKLLLIRGPRRGWECPGGRVEEGESIQAGAVREVKEETGIDVELTRFCGVYHNVTQTITIFLFRGRPTGGRLTTSEESLEVGYYPVDEGLAKVTWKNLRQRIESCLAEEAPFLVEFDEDDYP